MNPKLVRKQLLLYFILWGVLELIHFVLLISFYHINWVNALADSFIFNTIFALIGIGLKYAVPFFDLRKNQWFELLTQHLTGISLTTIIWFFSGDYLLSQIFSDDKIYLEFLHNSQTIRVLTGIFLYSLTMILFYLADTFEELQQRNARESQLYAQLKESELNLLRSQIRPHFLFNSLNSISALTLSDPGKAQEMIIKLSEFMRYSLNIGDEAMSTLDKELYHIQLYLDIEKIRFGKKLNIVNNIENDCLDCKLPAMILQPLVENAVKYGVYESTSTSNIYINTKCEKTHMFIYVINDYDPEGAIRKGTGTGLKNVARRLQTVYGIQNLINIHKSDRIFEVEIKIPCNERD